MLNLYIGKQYEHLQQQFLTAHNYFGSVSVGSLGRLVPQAGT